MLRGLRIFSSKSTVVKLDVEWLPLQLLKRVHGPGPNIFYEKLLRLTDIKGLSTISVHFYPGSADCACYFAALPEHFKQSAPQVNLCIDCL